MTPAPHTSATSEAELKPFEIVFQRIANRLDDLSAANTLLGDDNRLNAPDKIERNRREITWLKDTRSELKLALRAASSPARVVSDNPDIPLVDHDEISRLVLDQPWHMQKALVTISSHCIAITDQEPSKEVRDLAGCISQNCLELAQALPAPADGGWQGEPVAWQMRLREGDDWSGWSLISRGFYSQIKADIDQGYRQDYQIRALYTAPPTSHASNERGGET